MIILDFLFEHKNAILEGAMGSALLILVIQLIKLILKHHKAIMNFVGKTVKFSNVYIIPLMFMVAISLDPKYSLQEKHILALYFCGLGIAFGYLYKLAENIDNNQQKTIS